MRGFARKDERGQGAAEFAIAAPILLILLFAAMQYAWTLYCGNVLTEAVESTRLNIQLTDVPTDPDEAAQIIADKLVENRPVLASGNMTVSNASIRELEGTVRSVQMSDEDLDEYMVGSANVISKRVEITADIEYEPVVLFPLFGNTHYTRQIRGSTIVKETFELG